MTSFFPFPQIVAFALIESRVEGAFDSNIKQQKRCLDLDVIATSLSRAQFLPDSLFDPLWSNVVSAVTELMAEEKPYPELLSASLRIMSRLKNSKQGVRTSS